METKLVKAYCSETKNHYGLEVAKFGLKWKVVNMIPIEDDKAKLIASEVKQDSFETNETLLPCTKCQSRKVGGCNCSKTKHSCSKNMNYFFDCIYCKNFIIDYSIPTAADVAGKKGDTITLGQNKTIKIVTFKNVTWTKYDNLMVHENGSKFNEPTQHVITKDTDIEFHGYNISAMNEGVYYTFDPQDGFDISCDIDTSKIQPHPGGQLTIKLGLVSAILNQNGGSFLLDGKNVGSVGSRFKMRLSFVNGQEYKVEINGSVVGKLIHRESSTIRVDFNFSHESHYCELLSHAYITNIKMQQGALEQ